MVNEQNLTPKTEIIYELKEEYKTPSFEEFMKNYEYDSNLNYDDLNSGDIATPKGYGPTTYAIAFPYYYSLHLRIECHNWKDFGQVVEVNSISEAERQINRLRNRSWYCAEWISNDVLDKCADLVQEAVNTASFHRKVDGYIEVKGTFWGMEAKWEGF